MSPVSLRTRYLGLELDHPLVASSSPLTGSLDGLRRLEDAGAAAVVLPSLFEEQITRDALHIHGLLERGAHVGSEAWNVFPEPARYDAGPDRLLELLASARSALGIPVLASLNGTTPGGWVEYARLLEEAGAHALELNLYEVAANPATRSEEVEARHVELVREVRSEVALPLAVKIGPGYTALARMARRLVEAGAGGLVLFNRFYQPDLDLDTLEVVPRLELSTSRDLLLPLRWIGILHGALEASLAATGGVHRPEDALKALLVGADVAMLASALLLHGPEHLRVLREGLRNWMEEREYASVAQLRGSVSRRSVPDPTAFERAAYFETLQSYALFHTLP